jgi:Asp-tRNA(Asn)/Glu-tRNA(Gln) amidotransferase A subunit family amidase
MSEGQWNRRDLLKSGVSASLGAMMHANPSTRTLRSPAVPSGLADEYPKYDGLGLAELIAKKQVTPLELLTAVRQRVELLNPKLSALCHLFFDQAEAQIDQKLGTGQFRGVPFVLKDLGMYLTGTITSAGSRVWKNNVANFDSTLVSRYKKAGLVIFGKSNSPELGLTATTESVLFGQTRNPWSLERTTGGSSGGSATIVASRILPMAHGSDGGGSIRIPASCCGVFGFKPTRSRVPLGPSQFESWNGCSHHHALTISVRDSAALLDASVGQELGSPFFSPAPAHPFLDEVANNPGSLRIALITASTTGAPLDPECRKAVFAAAKLCESLGHKVEEAALPINAELLREAFFTVLQVSLARTLDDAATTLGRPVSQQDVETVTWATTQAATNITSVSYSRAIATLHQIGLAMARFQQNYDVILSPTLSKPPVPLGVLSLSQDPTTFRTAIAEFMHSTRLYNATGQPSMSVPLHWTPEGLPVGVMFSGRFGEDALLFRLAAQLERAQPWANRRPQL